MTRTRRFIPLVLTAAAFALGACGGASAAADSNGDLEKQVQAYVECLRENGADVPDPTVDEKGNITFGQPAAGQTFDRAKIQEAQKKCGEPPEGITSGMTRLNDPATQDAAVKFAQCMRAEGVNVPDPDLSKIGSGEGGAFGDIDRDDPKVSAAIDTCQHVWTDAGIGGR